MEEFLENLDSVSFVSGLIFAYVFGLLISLINLIDSRIYLNNWMIRLTRAKLGKKEPKPLWVRIREKFFKLFHK